jgi:ADP-ribose pyrophosphatase YjhB (NUDIX family)
MRLFWKGAGILFWKVEGKRVFVHLGKRNVDPEKGQWSVPGGGMDTKDNGSFLNCAIRETNEEYFSYKKVLRKDSIKGLNYFTYKVPMVFTYVTYFVKVKNINPRPNFEFSKVDWFDINLLPLDIHEGALKAVNYLRSKLNK